MHTSCKDGSGTTTCHAPQTACKVTNAQDLFRRLVVLAHVTPLLGANQE